MKIIIAGGGRNNTQLALLLITQNHDVRIIEHRHKILNRMHTELPTETIFEGDATDPNVLESAGIENADVMVAGMQIDADNLVLCYIAKKQYHVGRTIAQINNPRKAWLFDDKLMVDVALNQSQILAIFVQEHLPTTAMKTLMKIHEGEFSLIEEKILPNTKAVGKAISGLKLPANIVFTCIIREGKTIIPKGDTVLSANDEVIALTDKEGTEKLIELFK